MGFPSHPLARPDSTAPPEACLWQAGRLQAHQRTVAVCSLLPVHPLRAGLREHCWAQSHSLQGRRGQRRRGSTTFLTQDLPAPASHNSALGRLLGAETTYIFFGRRGSGKTTIRLQVRSRLLLLLQLMLSCKLLSRALRARLAGL